MTTTRSPTRTLRRYKRHAPSLAEKPTYPHGKPGGVDPSAMAVVAAILAVGEQIEALTNVIQKLAQSVDDEIARRQP